MIKVNADLSENEDLLREYDVRSIPTLLLMDDSGHLRGKMIGILPEADLRNWLQGHVDLTKESEQV